MYNQFILFTLYIKVLYVEENELQNELTSIRSMMERSSKFISLSGLSGILAGVYALVGAGFAWHVLASYPVSGRIGFGQLFSNSLNLLTYLSLIALAVLLLSISTGIILSLRKARKQGQSVWNVTSRALLFNMSVPLVTGGVLIFIIMEDGYFHYISPFMLIFYGLSLLLAGNYTYKEIKYLGLSEIVLGLIAAALPVTAYCFGLLVLVCCTLFMAALCTLNTISESPVP